jgi:hypothetical protein
MGGFIGGTKLAASMGLRALAVAQTPNLTVGCQCNAQHAAAPPRDDLAAA